jgi:hypothetical protein
MLKCIINAQSVNLLKNKYLIMYNNGIINK